MFFPRGNELCSEMTANLVKLLLVKLLGTSRAKYSITLLLAHCMPDVKLRTTSTGPEQPHPSNYRQRFYEDLQNKRTLREMVLMHEYLSPRSKVSPKSPFRECLSQSS